MYQYQLTAEIEEKRTSNEAPPLKKKTRSYTACSTSLTNLVRFDMLFSLRGYDCVRYFLRNLCSETRVGLEPPSSLFALSTLAVFGGR